MASDELFLNRLEKFELHPNAARDVAVPGRPGTRISWTALHGLLAGDYGTSDPRSYSSIDMVDFGSDLHLIAFSDQTPDPSRRPDHYQIVQIAATHGKERMPKSHTVWGGRKGERRYVPNRIETMIREKRGMAPWLCFTTNPCRPSIDHVRQTYPAFHWGDIRTCVESPEEDVVVVDGETYVSLWKMRPSMTLHSLGGQLELVRNYLGASQVGPIWGRLNNRPFHMPQGTRLAPFQAVVQYGVFDRLEKNRGRIDGYPTATGVFREIPPFAVDMSRRASKELLREPLQKTKITAFVNGQAKKMSLADEIALQEPVSIRFCQDSVVRFLRYCARKHAAAPKKWPGFPYRQIIEFVHAVDPEVLTLALSALESKPARVRSALISVLPSIVPIPWIVTYDDIANDHSVSASTARRRAKELGIAIPHRNGVQRRDYEEHRSAFAAKIGRSIYSSSTKGYRSGRGFAPKK